MSATASPARSPLRAFWLVSTVGLSLVAFAAAIVLAPAGSAQPGTILARLLFLGASVHVASSAWFYWVPEVHSHMRRFPRRYRIVPLLLIGGAAVVSAAVPQRYTAWALLGFFAWQFFHFQMQNLGLATLAGMSSGAGPMTVGERRALIGAGLAGIAGLLVHPDLLQLDLDVHVRYLFPYAAGVYGIIVLYGLFLATTRPRRTTPFLVVYLLSLLFFLPVFVLRAPLAAVAGMTIAHGMQYLLLMFLLAGRRSVSRTPLPPGGRRLLSVLVLINVALIGGLVLNGAAHLHGHGVASRAIFGAYLGAFMAHFVLDARLWRLRDRFPRRFLHESLPYLVTPPPSVGAPASARPPAPADPVDAVPADVDPPDADPVGAVPAEKPSDGLSAKEWLGFTDE